jgi:hypothetical protein
MHGVSIRGANMYALKACQHVSKLIN